MVEKLRVRWDKARPRIAHWKLKMTRFDALGAGLVATYRKARETMGVAYDVPIPENFHE
jgi:hypothetical protein